MIKSSSKDIEEVEIKEVDKVDEKLAEIISRIQYGECKKCHKKNYAQSCIDELGGLCPECDKEIKKEAEKTKEQVKFSQDNKYKKVRGYSEVSRIGE